MNCNDCMIGPIQRLIACDNCSNGKNFDKIFKLINQGFKDETGKIDSEN